jgi:hypothetical protein
MLLMRLNWGSIFKEVNLIEVQNVVPKMITWTTKSIKGRQEWDLAFNEVGLSFKNSNHGEKKFCFKGCVLKNKIEIHFIHQFML